MFNYVDLKRSKIKKSGVRSSVKVFMPVKDGVILTDDSRALASSFDDYRADNLVAAGVDVSSPASPFNDVSLDHLDDVETASMNLLDKEGYIIQNDDKK